MVKVIRVGVKKPKYYWMGRQWKCGTCSGVVEFEESDAPTLKYDDDQRDGESIEFHCATCEAKTWFHPLKKS
jgi:hypothetical protein